MDRARADPGRVPDRAGGVDRPGRRPLLRGPSRRRRRSVRSVGGLVRGAAVGAAIVASAASASGLAQPAPTTASAAVAPAWSALRSQAQPVAVDVLPAAAERAVLVVIPGGGYTAGGEDLKVRTVDGNAWLWRELNRTGVSVAFVTHRDGGIGQGEGQIADVIAATEAVRRAHPTVPICLFGESSAGQYAAIAQIIRPDLSHCVVVDAGAIDVGAWLDAGDGSLSLSERLDRVYARNLLIALQGGGDVDRFERLDPARSLDRAGDLFTIFGRRNPDGSNADRLFQADLGQRVADRLPAGQVVVRHVSPAGPDERTLPWGHPLFFDGGTSVGRRPAYASARAVYDDMIGWIVARSACPTPSARAAVTRAIAADGPQPSAPVLDPVRTREPPPLDNPSSNPPGEGSFPLPDPEPPLDGAAAYPCVTGDLPPVPPAGAPAGSGSPPPASRIAPAPAGPTPPSATPPLRIDRVRPDAAGRRQGRVGLDWRVRAPGAGYRGWRVESRRVGDRRSRWRLRAAGSSGTRALVRLPVGGVYRLRVTVDDAAGQRASGTAAAVVAPSDDRARGVRQRGHWRHARDRGAWRGTRSDGAVGARLSVRLPAGRPILVVRGPTSAVRLAVRAGGRTRTVRWSRSTARSRTIVLPDRSSAGVVGLRVLAGVLRLDGVAVER